MHGAPILYAHSRRTSASLLVSDVWSTVGEFLANGEAAYSSVLLTAPAFDEDLETWVEAVFPLLEESLVAARVSRDVGIVCFHPRYETPSEKWLATHRFGHMYAPATLRRYCAEAGADDLAAPLRHAETYQALVDDVLDHRGGRATFVDNDASRTVDLRVDEDAFYAQHAARSFPDVIDASADAPATMSLGRKVPASFSISS